MLLGFKARGETFNLQCRQMTPLLQQKAWLGADGLAPLFRGLEQTRLLQAWMLNLSVYGFYPYAPESGKTILAVGRISGNFPL